METVGRRTLIALAVVLLVPSGAWAAPVSAAAGPAPASGAALDPAFTRSGTVPTVTIPTPTETTVNTTNTTESTNTTKTWSPKRAPDDGTATTVTISVEGSTATGSIVGEAGTTEGLTAELTTNGTVSGATGDAEVALLGTATPTDTTKTADQVTATPTPSETAGQNTSAGAGDGTTDSGTDGDVPGAAASVVLVGFGAAAVTMLFRRSATMVAFLPDIAVTVSRLPTQLVQRWSTGREWLPRILAAVGYSRYNDSDPLTHATRAELYDLIAKSPGTYLSELSEQANVPTSTIRHHLDVLVREGVVTTSNVRGKRRYFSLDAGNQAIAAALSDDASAAIIECLANTGPASVSTIADDLNRDVSTVSHHLGRLADDGLVERERDGRSVYNELVPEVEDALGSDGSGRSPRRA